MFPLEDPKTHWFDRHRFRRLWLGCNLCRARLQGNQQATRQPDAEIRARTFIADTWDALRRLGIATSERAPDDSLTFVAHTR